MHEDPRTYVESAHQYNTRVTAVATNKDTIFYKAFFSYSPKEREALMKTAGVSRKYVQKQTYVKDGSPVFRFNNALKLDKASKGKLSFLEHAEGIEDMDLDYLYRRLGEHRKAVREAKARKTLQKVSEEVLTTTP